MSDPEEGTLETRSGGELGFIFRFDFIDSFLNTHVGVLKTRISFIK
jgi:hypothetical protein